MTMKMMTTMAIKRMKRVKMRAIRWGWMLERGSGWTTT